MWRWFIATYRLPNDLRHIWQVKTIWPSIVSENKFNEAKMCDEHNYYKFHLATIPARTSICPTCGLSMCFFLVAGEIFFAEAQMLQIWIFGTHICMNVLPVRLAKLIGSGLTLRQTAEFSTSFPLESDDSSTSEMPNLYDCTFNRLSKLTHLMNQTDRHFLGLLIAENNRYCLQFKLIPNLVTSVDSSEVLVSEWSELSWTAAILGRIQLGSFDVPWCSEGLLRFPTVCKYKRVGLSQFTSLAT